MKISLKLNASSDYFETMREELIEAQKLAERIEDTHCGKTWGHTVAKKIMEATKTDELELSAQDIMQAAKASKNSISFVILKAGLYQEFESNNAFLETASGLKLLREATTLKEHQVDSTLVKAISEIARLHTMKKVSS